MPFWVECLAALVLFATGLRVLAFFAGSETGFYRLSIPRLSIDARAGDRPATWLMWFVQHPSYFVATCLIGGNLGSYLCTAAVGWGIALCFGVTTETLEVVVTLALSPIIFELGELLPKSIYYLAPYARLRQEVPWFSFFFRLFLPLSWPLMQVTRWLERLSGQTSQETEIVLGRGRLLQLVQHGRREGVLSDLQSRLANGLLQLAPQTVVSSMIPKSRVLGVSDESSKAEMIEFARKFGLAAVAVHRAHNPDNWYGYAFVAELLASRGERPVIHLMPVISNQTSKLEALYRMQLQDASYGVVVRQADILGIVARNGLIEQVFRPDVGVASRALA